MDQRRVKMFQNHHQDIIYVLVVLNNKNMYKNSKFKLIPRLFLMLIGLGLLFYDKTIAIYFIFTALSIMIIADLFLKKRSRNQA